MTGTFSENNAVCTTMSGFVYILLIRPKLIKYVQSDGMYRFFLSILLRYCTPGTCFTKGLVHR